MNYQSNNKCFTKTFLLLCLSIFLVCFTNTAKAGLSCNGVWPYVVYDLEETVSQPSDSTLFNPTIEVKRAETISSIKCTETFKLTASECKFSSSGLYRYCARYTEPDEHGNDYACNTTDAVIIDGVEEEPATINCNYDSNGESTGDDDCPGCRCQCSQRVCAYNDPQGADGMGPDYYEPSYGIPGNYDSTSDNDYRYCCIEPPLTYNFMPYHKNTDNPCCGMNGCNLWGSNPCGDGTQPDGKVINGTADHIGCVDIPLGPYPPPLCDPIQGATPGAVDINICAYSPDYELDSDDPNYPDGNYKQTSIACSDGSPTCDSVCELSTTTGNPTDDAVYSTFEKPLVRVFFASTLPLCASDYVVPATTPTNDTCVQFLNSSLTAEQIWTDKKDLIPVCAKNTTGPDCFSFPSQRYTGPAGSSTTYGTDYDYFKTYYNVFGSSVVSESDTMPYGDYSYGDSSSTTTVDLAGLYDTYYEDMTDNFNMSTDPADAYTVEIIDYTSLDRTILSYLNLGDDDGEDGMTLCAYEDSDTTDDLDTIVCVDRPKMFAPTVYPCLYAGDCQYPSSMNPYEQPRIDFDVGDPTKSGIIGIDIPEDTTTQTFCVIDDYYTSAATESSADNTDPCTVYKAKIFSAYLTDDDNYQLTSDDDGTVTPPPDPDTGTYVGGMQYVDNIYCRGATKICLTGYSSSKIVISKIVPLTTYDSNDNEVVTNVASNLISDRVIPPPPADGEEETYPLPDDILYNSTDNDWISSSSQPVTTTYFGYLTGDPDADPDDPNSYIPQSYCNTGEESSADYIMCTANGTIPDIATDTPSDDISCTCSNTTSSSYSCTNGQCQLVWSATTNSDTQTLEGYQYTDPATGTTTYYSSDDYMERALNVMELAQCTDAAQPFCDAVTGLTTSSSTAADNGYADWPQTYVDDETNYTACVEGRQPQQDDDGNDIIPTRYCRYMDEYNNDGTTVLKSNGCPEYTIAFDTVENGCVKAALPAWWPSQFLTNKPSLQGAIFNQFNIAPPYEDIFIPKSANYNPYDVQSITLGNDGTTWVEDWYTTSSYNSCKNYKDSRTTSNTKRNVTDGDQEMLHLKQDHWESLWNDQDLTWLLVDDSSNNGCYVYNLGTNVNATNATIDSINAGTITVGMKICKYDTKISFSLVDLAYNSATDYTNIAYMMQSNIIAYDAYTTQDVTENVSNEDGFVPQTKITTNSLPNKKNKYHNYINHGIVVDKDGFDPFETDKVVPGPPPFATTVTVAEEIGTSFYFSGVYNYKTSYKDDWGNTKHRDYAVYSFSSPPSCGEGNDHSYENDTYDAQKTTNNYPSCALSQYRGAINYSDPDSSSRENISKYLPSPTDIDPLDISSTGSGYSYVTRQYFNSCYNGSNMDDSWPYQDGCIQKITIGSDLPGGISGYTYGNSAMNVNMFLWSSDKSYDVCNE